MRKIIFRILVFPFIFCIHTMLATYSVFIHAFRWLRYGGEIITKNKDTNQTIADLFTLVEQSKNDSSAK